MKFLITYDVRVGAYTLDEREDKEIEAESMVDALTRFSQAMSLLGIHITLIRKIEALGV